MDLPLDAAADDPACNLDARALGFRQVGGQREHLLERLMAYLPNASRIMLVRMNWPFC